MDDLSKSQTDYIGELKLSDHVEHDGYMPNVYPPRKMFSTQPVTTDNNNQGKDMRIIKALAKAIKKRPLQNQKLNKENKLGGKYFDPAQRNKYL